MSDARVNFLDLGYDETTDPAEIARFGFACPTHKGRRCEGLLIRAAAADSPRPSWIWDGNAAAPTFEPSVNCQGCWHGYIRGGRCVNTSGQDEPEP